MENHRLIIIHESHKNPDAVDLDKFNNFINDLETLLNRKVNRIDSLGIVMDDFTSEQYKTLTNRSDIILIEESKPISIQDSY